jgi:ABC-2 type transport system ATP-binding protein
MTIIEVLSDSPSRAQTLLTGLPEVRSVTQLGVKLRVLVPTHIGAPLDLVSTALRDSGFRAECRIVAASLEDVFVAVTRDGDTSERAA